MFHRRKNNVVFALRGDQVAGSELTQMNFIPTYRDDAGDQMWLSCC